MRPTAQVNIKGQTLIGILISLAIFSILSSALFALVSSSYSSVTFNKARTAAKYLAEEKMETIRNMSYNQIGTLGGIPTGTLPQSENVSLNGLNYTIKTSIIYIDDPFDNLAPNDLLPTDYKRLRVDVSWEGLASSRNNPVTLISDISPQGIETTASGGTLSILVFDANANPVGQADVTIVATTTNPQINLSLKTGDNGRVILPGAPVCRTACYQISVSKAGYSTDRTYSTSEVANPNKPYLSVLQGKITEVSFAIDRTGTLNVFSYKDRSNNFDVLPNLSFQIRGEKTIGTDNDDNPVYKFSQNYLTGSDGKKTVQNLEWDNYHINVDATSGWDISGANPLLPINLLPNQNIDSKISLSTHTVNSELISFVDKSGIQIASVSARLYDNKGYEATSSSGLAGNPDFGQVFFSNLTKKIFNLSATASGYMNFNGNVDVAGYKQERVILNPQ